MHPKPLTSGLYLKDILDKYRGKDDGKLPPINALIALYATIVLGTWAGGVPIYAIGSVIVPILMLYLGKEHRLGGVVRSSNTDLVTTFILAVVSFCVWDIIVHQVPVWAGIIIFATFVAMISVYRHYCTIIDFERHDWPEFDLIGYELRVGKCDGWLYRDWKSVSVPSDSYSRISTPPSQTGSGRK